MAGIAGRVVTMAAGAIVSNAQQLKPVVAPAAEIGKGAGLIVWGTLWKSLVFQVAALFLWVSICAFTFTFGQTGFMGSTPVLVLTAFIIFALIPTSVFLFETFRVRKVVARKRAALAEQRKQDEENRKYWEWQAERQAVETAEQQVTQYLPPAAETAVYPQQ